MFGLKILSRFRSRLAAALVATPVFIATQSAAHAPAADRADIGQSARAKAEATVLGAKQQPPVAVETASKDAAPMRVMTPIAVPVPRAKPVVAYPMPKAKPAVAQTNAKQQEFKVASKGAAQVVKTEKPVVKNKDNTVKVAKSDKAAAAPVTMPAAAVKQQPGAQARVLKGEIPPGVHVEEEVEGQQNKRFIERVTLVFDGLTWHLLKKDDSIKGHNKDTTRLVTCGGGKYNKGLKNGQYNCRPDGVGVKVDVGDIVGIDGAYVGVYGFQNSFGKPVRAVLVGKNWDVLDGKVTLGLSIGYDFAGGYKSRIVGAPEVAFNLDKITGRQELAGLAIVAKVSPLGITRDGHSSVAGLIGVQYKFSNSWLKPQL